jgi:hypothetical protein
MLKNTIDWTKAIIIARFRKNPVKEARISVVEQQRVIDIRSFQRSYTGDFVPTQDGITFSLIHLSKLKKGIEAVEKKVAEWEQEKITKKP